MAKVLIVDDDEHVLTTLRLAFERRGHLVTAVLDPTEVHHLARRESPDVMLLDLMMPGLDGYQLYLQLTEDPALARVPIVMITARTGDIYERISRELGIKLHLTKPFDPFTVVERVEALLTA